MLQQSILGTRPTGTAQVNIPTKLTSVRLFQDLLGFHSLKAKGKTGSLNTDNAQKLSTGWIHE